MTIDSDMHWTELISQARDDLSEDLPDVASMSAEDADAIRDEAILRACEAFYGHGFSDDQLGDADGFGHYYRVSRWTVETDSRGFSAVTEHGSEREAIEWWQTLEDEYAEWSGPQEDDATITDLPMHGYAVAIAGKSLGEFDSREAAEDAIRAENARGGYYPDVWLISDHGNATRIALES
jgi:hypothetical protein